MNKKLTRHGNSLALVIDKPILRLLRMDEATEVELLIEDNKLIIKAVTTKTKKKTKTEISDEKIKKTVHKIMDRYDNTFKKLAKE